MVTRCGICGKITAVTWPEFYVYKIGDCYYCSANCMAVADVKQRREKSGFVKEDSEMRGKITLEQKKKAVEIALDGGDPRDYLKACGSKNPDAHWYYIKNKLKDTDPGTYYALIGPVGVLAAKLDGFEPFSVPKNDQEPEEDLVDKALPEEEPEGDKAVYTLPKVPEDAAERTKRRISAAEIRERLEKEPVVPAPEEKDLESIADTRLLPLTIRMIPEGITVCGLMTDFGGFDKTQSPITGETMIRWNHDDCGEIMFTPDEWMAFAKKIPEIIGVMEPEI